MGSGGTCHECRRYACICGDPSSKLWITKLQATEAVQAEEEFEGDMPDKLYNMIVNSSKAELEQALRAMVQRAKASIIERIEGV